MNELRRAEEADETDSPRLRGDRPGTPNEIFFFFLKTPNEISNGNFLLLYYFFLGPEMWNVKLVSGRGRGRGRVIRQSKDYRDCGPTEIYNWNLDAHGPSHLKEAQVRISVAYYPLIRT